MHGNQNVSIILRHIYRHEVPTPQHCSKHTHHITTSATGRGRWWSVRSEGRHGLRAGPSLSGAPRTTRRTANVTGHRSQVTGHRSQVTGHSLQQSPVLRYRPRSRGGRDRSAQLVQSIARFGLGRPVDDKKPQSWSGRVWADHRRLGQVAGAVFLCQTTPDLPVVLTCLSGGNRKYLMWRYMCLACWFVIKVDGSLPSYCLGVRISFSV